MPQEPPLTAAFITNFLSPTNVQFFEYWKTLNSESSSPPKKAAIDPSKIKAILPHLVIYERKEAAVFHIRLMGTAAVERIGYDLTGRNLLEFFHYAAKDEAQRDLNRIVQQPCGQFLLVKDRFASGREALVEIVRLPLSDEKGKVRYIIGCTEERKTTGFPHPRGDEPELIAERLENFFFDLGGAIEKNTE